MDPQNKLAPYVKAYLDAGMTQSAIERQLIDMGWDASVVSAAIAASTSDIKASDALADISLESIVPEDYSITDSLRDVFRAVKYNPLILIVVAVLVTVLSVVLLTQINKIGYSALDVDDSFTVYTVPLWPLLLLVPSAAYVQSILGLWVYDCLGRRSMPLKAYIVAGLRPAFRLLVAQTLLGLVLATPVLIAWLIGQVLPYNTLASIFMITIAVVAAIPLLVRFIMVPTIAIFEPKLPVFKLFDRSMQLLSGGGVGFVAKYLLLLLLINILVPSGSALRGAPAFVLVAWVAIAVIVDLVAGAVLVAFYRNRKAVRG